MNFLSARSKLIKQLRQEIKDKKVLQAIGQVPREFFVPSSVRPFAYDDRPQPIGMEQTISQPFIVALMTSTLELKGTEKVLEVGTGSGYQAAILSLLAARVITVERHPSLAQEARKRLAELGYANIEVCVAEATLGWPKEAPYDGIIVTAAAPQVAKELLSQLGAGGRMVIPVGSREEQELLKIVKREKEVLTSESLGACRFVPLVGMGAWEYEPGA